jgi:hypothetical protein
LEIVFRASAVDGTGIGKLFAELHAATLVQFDVQILADVFAK